MKNKKNILLSLLTLISLASNSQKLNCDYPTPPKNLPIPDMFVKKDIGIQREKNFIIKHSIILAKKDIDINDQIFYTKNAFTSMITYFCKDLKFTRLIVIIAQYPDKADLFTPKGWENKLTVLFKPERDDDSNLGYYTINDNAPTYTKLDPGIGESWIAKYDSSILPQLLNTLSDDDGDNEYPKASHKFQDTHSVTYCADDWIQLLMEIDYQEKYVYHKGYVSGINMLFSAFGVTGNGDDSNKSPRFRFRLIPQFEFTTTKAGKNVVFYIDDQKDFLKIRKTKQFLCGENWVPAMKINSLGLDNGKLCPPHCP